MPGWKWRGETGSAWQTWSRVSRTLAALNGTRPVSISYSIAPSAYTSAGGPAVRVLPPACSGAM